MKKLQKAITINSKLYSHLLDEGNDSLIAVYAILRFCKHGAIKYYNEDKLTGYKLLHNKTKLSLTTLKKYIPELIKLGLCTFDKHNQLVLTGTNKINKLYKSKKLVPIEIGTFKQTKLFSFRVRIFKMEQQQKNRIDRKDRLTNIIEKKKNNRFLSKSQFAQFKAMKDLDWEYYYSNNFEANTVLSNQGYSKLKEGGVTSGAYWKKQLVSAGIIKTKRNIKIVRKCTKAEYQLIKKLDRRYSYYNGKLYKEFPSLFTTTDFYIKEKEPVKKLERLSFDFCHFLSLQ